MLSANTTVVIKKLYVEKNRKFMKNGGLFLSIAKGVFWFAFLILMFLWSGFCAFGKVAKVSKMLVSLFPILGAFVGTFLLVYLGLEGLGVFVFLVLFFFCLGFVFVFVCVVFVLVVGLCLVLFLFLCVLFFFWGGGGGGCSGLFRGVLFFLVLVCFVCFCWSVFVFFFVSSLWCFFVRLCLNLCVC